MPERVEIRTVTCPANTSQAAAVEADVSFPAGTVASVEVVIPAGHAGLTGIALGQAHTILIPDSGSAWIFGDDDHLSFDLDGYLNNGGWQAHLFNTDTVWPHSWQLRFHVFELRRPDPPRLVIPPHLVAEAGRRMGLLETGARDGG